jgi:hypothetical protein
VSHHDHGVGNLAIGDGVGEDSADSEGKKPIKHQIRRSQLKQKVWVRWEIDKRESDLAADMFAMYVNV